MKSLYLDCTSGISGDMFLGALIDLGLDAELLAGIFQQSGMDVTLSAIDDVRCGLAGKRLEIAPASATPPPLRHLKDIVSILERLPLSLDVLEQSRLAFHRLAFIEAKVHGVDPATIHFHEVGAVDTIVDVVGVFWGLEQLEIKKVRAGKLPWFQGQVHCAHGMLPLPAPAVAELLQGKPVYATNHRVELITPTGALLLDCLVQDFTSGPKGHLLKCGVGLGTMELADQPNALRCFLFEETTSLPARSAEEIVDEVVLLTTNIDHLTGEELGSCFDALFQEGALDVLFLPGVMKKNRPGGQIQVLCAPKHLPTVQEAFFRHTLSLGIRRQHIERVILPRQDIARDTSLGMLEMKQAQLNEQTYARPEFDALQKLARRTGRSVAQLRYLLQEKDEQSGKKL
ncbi:nickel pincer cofactor biosynthesis protein LarC [Desulfonatronum parangueonense]